MKFTSAALLASTAGAITVDDLPQIDINDFTTAFYDMDLDHFNMQNKEQFGLRFFENTKYVTDPNAPVFLYLCGEYTCSVDESRLFPHMVGAYYGAHLVTLEHRFYGESIPRKSLELDNLKHLSSEQALSDVASFLTKYNQFHPERKVVVIGGSYPGALSGWFLERYPHLATVGWSSSGVVYPIENFWSFDEQLFTSASYSGSWCPELISGIMDDMDEALKSDARNATMVAAGGDPGMHNGDFSFYFADIFTIGIQYGNRTDLCTLLNDTAELPFEDKLPHLSDFAKEIGVGPIDYCRYNIQNPNLTNTEARSWTYQYCAEFGWFQVPSPHHPMRSKEFLTLDYWREKCDYLFGVSPHINRTSAEYSFRHTAGRDTVFTNGREDPWQGATELNPLLSLNQVGALANCSDCGHCGDLYTPKDFDPQELKDERQIVLDFIDRKLHEEDLTAFLQW